MIQEEISELRDQAERFWLRIAEVIDSDLAIRNLRTDLGYSRAQIDETLAWLKNSSEKLRSVQPEDIPELKQQLRSEFFSMHSGSIKESVDEYLARQQKIGELPHIAKLQKLQLHARLILAEIDELVASLPTIEGES